MSFAIFINATAVVLRVPEKLTIESCAAKASNLFFAVSKGNLVILDISFAIFLSHPFFVFIPVPTAVPPCANGYISFNALLILARHFVTCM